MHRQAKLERTEAQTRLLEEAAKEHDSQVKAAVRKADELQSQVRKVALANSFPGLRIVLLLPVFTGVCAFFPAYIKTHGGLLHLARPPLHR